MRSRLLLLGAAALMTSACFTEPNDVASTNAGSTSSAGSDDASTTTTQTSVAATSSDSADSSSTGFVFPTGSSTDTGMVDTSDTGPGTGDPRPVACDCPEGSEYCSGFEEYDPKQPMSPFPGWALTPSSAPVTQGEGPCGRHAARASIVSGARDVLGSQLSRMQPYDVAQRGGFVFGGLLRISAQCFTHTVRVADVLANDGGASVNYRIELMLTDEQLHANYTPNGGATMPSSASVPAPEPGVWTPFAIELAPEVPPAESTMTLRVGQDASAGPLTLPTSGAGTFVSSLVGAYNVEGDATCDVEYDAIFLAGTPPP